jgi:ankyrin repeat protein
LFQLRSRVAAGLLLVALQALADEPAASSPAGLFGAAARRGDLTEVRRLLDAGVDVNTPFRYGATALFSACDRGYPEVVKLLLERGARTDIQDTFYGATPFTWALSPASGDPTPAHVEIARMLLAKGAGSRARVLASAAGAGRVAFVKLALEEKLPALDLGEALEAAAKESHTEVVELLKTAGAQPLPEPTAVVEKAVLQKYTGDYAGDGARAFRLTVVLLESGLAVRLGADPIPLGAYDERTFKTLKDPRLRLTFDPQGQSVAVKTPGGESVLKRSTGSQP